MCVTKFVFFRHCCIILKKLAVSAVLGTVIVKRNKDGIFFSIKLVAIKPWRMSENFKQGIFCHSERNEVERRISVCR